MTTPSDEYCWAVYDEYDFKLRGGFQTKEAATAWLTSHPQIIVVDEHGNEVRVASQREVDLIKLQFPNIVTLTADPREYRVLLETD
jgi:hypothetical protein